jgi:hypothetical protein
MCVGEIGLQLDRLGKRRDRSSPVAHFAGRQSELILRERIPAIGFDGAACRSRGRRCFASGLQWILRRGASLADRAFRRDTSADARSERSSFAQRLCREVGRCRVAVLSRLNRLLMRSD